MKIDGIRDGASLEAWLNTRPREDAVAIAHRVALRVFPLFGRAMREDAARVLGGTSLPVLWSCLISGVACENSPTIIFAPSIRSAFSADSAYSFVSSASARSAISSARSAASAARSAVSVVFAARSVLSAVAAVAARSQFTVVSSFSASAIWEAIRADAGVIISGSDVLEFPLWPSTPPDWFTKADWETRAIWAENPEHWDFWTRWWDAAIAGTPLDWDLQRDIALIPDEVWQQGPGPVAVEIARLEELHNLRRELAELKQRIEQPEQVIEAIAGADLRGHNNPPELIETPAELRETLVVIWEELREAEREVAKTLPEPGRLRRTGQAILSAAKSIAAYCLEVGDVVVKNAAKAVGAALGVGIVAAILSNLPAIAAFAEKLIAYGTRWLP